MKPFLSGALACVLALAGAAHADTLPIRIGAAQADNHAPVFVALEKGFFAEAGLDAKIILYPTGVEEVNAQLNGGQEVSILGTIPFLSGVSNGFPLLMIGQLHGDSAATSYSANQSVVASAASGIHAGSLAALKGKRIALPFGTDAQIYVSGILAQAGLKTSDVQITNAQPAQLLTALQQGDADAISVWEPWSSAAVQTIPGAAKVIEGGCTACFVPGTVLTSRDVVSGKAEVLRRFMVAFARGEQFVRQHPDEAAEVDTHWIQGIPLPVLQSSLRHSVFDPRLSKGDVEGFNGKTIPALLADRRLRAAFDAATAIDPQFIQLAEKQAPQYFSDLPPIPAALQLAAP
jgi:sulfonate transport system substrate-binding protein